MKVQHTVLCAAVASAFVASAPAFADDEVVKIGHVGPISGNIAHLGKDNENGAQMAIDELNARARRSAARRSRSSSSRKTTPPIRSRVPPPHRSWSTRRSTAWSAT